MIVEIQVLRITMACTEQIVQRSTLVIVLVLAVSVLTTAGKGFDANGEKNNGKLKICLAEPLGISRKATKNCAILKAKSNIECVIGRDRMDCMRRISKGTAHFGVFSPEELMPAKWSGTDVLITSEMRFDDVPFQYEVVAVVANDAQINSVHDLRGSRFCHPGYGLSHPWTDVVANYFESALIARECEEDLSPLESRIKPSAEFFGASCKPGAWVPDPLQDAILKKRYPSLCEVCYNPSTCNYLDKYWGRLGPLSCITSGGGEVAWVRLDDVRAYFGFTGMPALADVNSYSFLCLDGHLQPLHTKTPCVWVASPWPAVAAKREYASAVQLLLEHLNFSSEDSWQNALLSILESYHVNIQQLDNTIPIDDYLEQAVGYSSAYSFPSCNPPRAIVYCSTSLVEHAKCSWLQEVAGVNGIEPNLQCIREMSLERCMENVKYGASDVVFVDESQRIKAEREFQLRPHLYEYAKQKSDRYTVVAVVKTDSNIYNFNDLNKIRACFPSFEGAAYLSVLETIRHMRNITDEDKSYSSTEVDDFFAEDSCTWASHSSHCQHQYSGDEGALKCLEDNRGDVAFVDMAVFQQYIRMTASVNGTKPSINGTNPIKYKLICPFGRDKRPDELCHLHWTSRGYLMINNQTKLVRRNEIYNSIRDMDRLFGKHHNNRGLSVSMFGPFDRQNNVMFHDRTEELRGIIEMERDQTPRFLELTVHDYVKLQLRRLREAPNSATIPRLDLMLAFIAVFMFVHYF